VELNRAVAISMAFGLTASDRVVEARLAQGLHP
jgi:hypothetical protein